MFGRKDVTIIVQPNREADSRLISVHEDVNKLYSRLCEISEAELKSKDRVDISLNEYNRLKNELVALSMENERLRTILSNIDVPLDKPIIPGSLRTRYYQDPVELKRVFQIEFEIKEREFRHGL